jgi:hypothetical protein
MPSLSTEAWRLLRQGLRAGLLLRPSAVAAALSPAGFVAAATLFLLVGFGIDSAVVDEPRVFNRWGLRQHGFPLLLALGAGLLGSALIRRPALALRLAALGLLASLPLQVLWAVLPEAIPLALGRRLLALAFGAYLLALALRLLFWAADRRPYWRPLAGAVLTAGMAVAGLAMLPGSPWWWPLGKEAPPHLVERDYSAEALLYAQPALLERAIAQLRPQRHGQIDLYAIGFAGDGMESVFRNEVEHFERLVSQRFGSPDSTLALINHPDTLEQRPLATLSNLRLALGALAQRMDVEEDILLLFMTSHGSAEHELHVALDDLPLDPVSPQQLAEAIEATGIRWRVLIISACYSGGFIESLADADTLIITAARADRTSFGCGVDSEITWFGQALLAEALNQTLDFADAFALAKRAVRARERARDERASYPQIRVGEQIATQLARWRETVTPGDAVPFRPAVSGNAADEPTTAEASP